MRHPSRSRTRALRGVLGLCLGVLCLAPATVLLSGCEPSYEEQAAEAMALQDYELAAERLTRAAIAAGCPDRARLLLLRAEAQVKKGLVDSVRGSLDAAIRNCPDYTPAYWERARHADRRGDKDQALADADHIRATHPEAEVLYQRIQRVNEARTARRTRSEKLLAALERAFDPKAATRSLGNRGDAVLARQIPRPLTLVYAVKQVTTSPKRFDMLWRETWSYRGDPAEAQYALVRSLELPPIDRELPLYYKLALANLRHPMRFKINEQGQVLHASWLRSGHDRGMRPEMLQPEIDGILKRRRLYDPGESGVRRVGESWGGKDVRVVDGKPVSIAVRSTAAAWEEVAGLRTLRVESRLTGEGYSGDETVWLQPETAVPVRWERGVEYRVFKDSGEDLWREELQGLLTEISVGN